MLFTRIAHRCWVCRYWGISYIMDADKRPGYLDRIGYGDKGMLMECRDTHLPDTESCVTFSVHYLKEMPCCTLR